MHAVLAAAAMLGPRRAVHVAGLAVLISVEAGCDSTTWEYGLYVIVWYSTVKCITIWFVTVIYCAVECITIWYARCNVVQ